MDEHGRDRERADGLLCVCEQDLRDVLQTSEEGRSEGEQVGGRDDEVFVGREEQESEQACACHGNEQGEPDDQLV